MRALSIFVVLAVLMAACQAAFAQKKSADDELYDRVRQRLAADRDVKGGGIDVDVKDGVVTLRGKVREGKQRVRAEHLVRKTKGVQKVVNELVVELPPGRSAGG
ncbi:MAG: BON domain-containing protein [Bryobacteraceae bacterium]|jgi:osmotically-inducible protein OsmY